MIPAEARPLAPNRGKRYPAEPLTPAEMQAILAGCSRRSASGIRNRAMLTLLYRSGLRISEILSLRPADINLDAHSIRLRRTKSGVAQTRAFHPSCDDSLARWLDARRDLGVARGRPLFCTLAGGPLRPEYVRIALRRYADRAGIVKRVHPHGLRHTHAVELEQAGLTVTQISKALGHSSIAVTARYLDHLSSADAVAAVVAADLPALT